MAASELEIERTVAKLAITDVLHRYARGLDRMDRELTLSCWHPGGTDDHAPLYAGSAEGFIEWLWPVHAAMEVTRHTISNIIIEVDGDRAGSESYYQVTLRVKGSDGVRYDILGQGRYVDRLERIGACGPSATASPSGTGRGSNRSAWSWVSRGRRC